MESVQAGSMDAVAIQLMESPNLMDEKITYKVSGGEENSATFRQACDEALLDDKSIKLIQLYTAVEPNDLKLKMDFYTHVRKTIYSTVEVNGMLPRSIVSQIENCHPIDNII